MGLDSLERMEILASLEERFGGRFPEEILPELETCRQVVAAVEKYLGGQRPRARRRSAGRARGAAGELPASTSSPNTSGCEADLDCWRPPDWGIPTSRCTRGSPTTARSIDGRELINFSSYNYLGMSGDPRGRRRPPRRPSTATAPASRPAGWSPARRTLHRELERAIAGFLGTEAALAFVGGHATNETVIGHLFGPGDLVLHDALAHNSIIQGAILSGARRRPFPAQRLASGRRAAGPSSAATTAAC